jgi:hypothetical protein
VIGSLYSHQVPIQSTTNPAKVIQKYGIFQFEEDATTTPWHVSSPLNLAPATRPLPKFKENLPRFSGNNMATTNEYLVEFYNACHNIGVNDNDTCMHLFVNSLEGLRPISLTFLLRLFLLGRSYYIGSSLPMGNPKVQPSSYGSTITSLIRMVKLSSLPTCVSLDNTTKSLNSFALRTKPISCITVMLYLLPIVTGLRKRPLITLVPLCIFF